MRRANWRCSVAGPLLEQHQGLRLVCLWLDPCFIAVRDCNGHACSGSGTGVACRLCALSVLLNCAGLPVLARPLMPPALPLPVLHRRCAALRGIRDDIEKEHAFLGLCALLRLNPQVHTAPARLSLVPDWHGGLVCAQQHHPLPAAGSSG